MSKPYRNKKLRTAAQGRSCVLCKHHGLFVRDTTVLAHLPGSSYGMAAGMGQKTHDWLGAHLCAHHHELMDSRYRNDHQMRLMALCLTLERLFDDGTLTVS